MTSSNFTQPDMAAAIDEIAEHTQTLGLVAASAETWRDAIGTILADYAHYAHGDDLAGGMHQVKFLCKTTLYATADKAFSEWKRRRQPGAQQAHVALSSAELCAWWHSLITVSMSRNTTAVQSSVNQQRYLVAHDMAWLCHEPALILDTTFRAQLEQQYPGILAMADLLSTLYGDQDSRRAALLSWQATQGARASVDLDTLGSVTPV